MKKIVAVFDIDGTILNGTSTERLFFKHLLLSGEIGLKDSYNFMAAFFRYFLADLVTATKGNKWYLKGKEYNRIKEMGVKYFKDVIVKKISDIAVDIIEKHRQEGHEIILLSGAFDFFMDEYLKCLNLSKGYCTVLEVKDGKYTGNISGIFPYGINKATILEAQAESIDFKNSFAYANHCTDVHFMKMFGNAVAVNPDGKLLEYARENNLRVLYS